MKQLLSILALVCFGLPQVCALNDPVNIPDNNFLQALIQRGVDIDGDEKISYAEAKAVTTLNLEAEGISDLTGIEAFINLETLDCSGNELSTLDVSYNTALSLLKCSDNGLNYLEGLYNTSLTELWCDYNELTSLEVSGNASLNHLICSGNKLTTLDVSENSALTELWCNTNELTSLDVSENTALNALICSGNSLQTLDLSKNNALKSLRVHANQLENLDVSNNTVLTELWCNSNKLARLDVSKNTNLEVLNCEKNSLTSLDLTNEDALWYLNCGGNNMIHLDVSGNDNLRELYLTDMNRLGNVGVWSDPFPPEGVNVYSKGSPYVKFTDDCKPPEILSVAQQGDQLEVTSSENGTIWLLPSWKERIFDQIRNACNDSVQILANDPVNLSLSSCNKVGVYWLYASDMNGNVSAPVSYLFKSLLIADTKEKSDEIFRMYPNPASSVLTIENEQSGSWTIEITSITGQLIYKKVVNGATIQLDISSLYQGEYFVTIRSGNSVRTGKLQKL